MHVLQTWARIAFAILNNIHILKKVRSYILTKEIHCESAEFNPRVILATCFNIRQSFHYNKSAIQFHSGSTFWVQNNNIRHNNIRKKAEALILIPCCVQSKFSLNIYSETNFLAQISTAKLMTIRFLIVHSSVF